MLLAAFMAVTSVGWTHADNTVYYTIGSASGGTGTQGAPITGTSLETLLTAVNANTTADSIVINLPDGEYTVTSGTSFSITKPGVSIIGTDSNKVVIKSPFDITLSQKGNISFASLQIAATTSVGRGLVDIKSSNTTVSFRETKLNIEGAGTGDGGPTVCFGIVSQLDVDNNTVNFIASHMYMSKGNQRGLCFRYGAGHTLNMENSKINGPSGGSGYPYVMGIGSWPGGTSETKPVTYNIKNSVVDVNYYAVFTNNQATPAVPIVINIEGSDITAWSALYLRGDGAEVAFPHTVNISDTRLNGRSYFNGPSDGFGTIVLDNCQQMNLTMDSKCRITATNKTIQSSVNTYMVVADVRKKTAGTWTFVPVDGDTCLIQSNNDIYTPTLFALEPTAALTVNGIENVKFQSEGGKPCITVYKKDGSLRNATSDIQTLLEKVSISDGDRVVFPEGTFTLPKTFVLDKSLTIEGAGKDKTTITGTIQITATDGAKVNFDNLHLSAPSTDKHAIEVGTNKGNESPDITITNCNIDNANNGVRLMGANAKLAIKNTDITARYYGISVRNEKQQVTIEGGTIKGWAAIMTSAGGLTTGDGTVANTGTTINIKNAVLKAATISDEGYGVVVLQEKYNGVVLTIEGSTLEATDENKDSKGAGVKALSTLDIRSYGNKVTVKNSTLSSLYGENYILLKNDTLHAAVVNLGWHGSNDQSTLADNIIEIVGSQLKEKPGESLVYSYREKEKKAYDKLTINGTIYDPASGLICYGEQDLQSKIDNAIANETILLPVGKYELSKQLTINVPVTLQGIFTDTDSTIIIASSENWTGSDGSSKHLISIQSNGATLKNLVVEGSQSPTDGSGSGINVYTATDVTLDDVISRNNKAAGLIVNGSTVTATNFRTSGNAWYGVNVDKGQGVSNEPVFTIGSGCSFAEAVAVVSDDVNAPASYVVGNGWFKTKANAGDKDFSVWINGATSGLNFAITSVPSSVIYGQANLPLLTNVDSAYIKADKVKITVPDGNGVVSIKAKANEAKYDSLQILKPGEVVLSLAVGDTTVTQKLTVQKRQLTIKGVTAKSKTYNGKTDVTLDASNAEASGYVDVTKGYSTLFKGIYGELTSKDAGIVPVDLKAFFNTAITDSSYYELDYVAVMDTVKKKDLTITAVVPQNSSLSNAKAINYGSTLPEFTTTPTGFENSESVSVLGGTLQFDCPATTTSLTGKYPVVPFGYTSNNYNIKYVADSLEIKAIAPTAELTGVKINSVGDGASITVSGRVLSNGGTKTDKLLAKLEAKTGNQTTKTVDNIKVETDGTFTADVVGLTSAAYTVDLTVSDGASLTSTTATSSSIALNAQLQNVRFTTELGRLVYGSTAALQAEGYQEGATVKFETSDASVLAFNEDTTAVIAKKKGDATITVTATLAEYVTAVAKQTITVEPKTLTVTPKVKDKVYDGKTSAAVTYTLNGVVNDDAVTVAPVTANFADANVGTKTVLLSGALVLSGNGNSNYQLVQPAEIKGTINKAGNLKVTATNVTRKYNEPVNALSYDLQVEGFVNGETLATALHSGAILVTESESTPGKYSIDVNKVSFPNYGTVTATGGDVNIVKGTPKVITVNTTANAGVAGILVDAQGWNLTQDNVTFDTEENKSYAYVAYTDNGIEKISRGAALAAKKATPPNINWDTPQTKALRSASADKELTYGQYITFDKLTGYSVATSDPAVLTLTETAGGTKMQVNAVGVGSAALIFTKIDDGSVTSNTIKVNQKPVSLTFTGSDKVYDGTTVANVSVSVDGLEGASLDLDDVTFNYASKDAGTQPIYPSKTILLKGDNAYNYELETLSLEGQVTPSTLKVTSAVSKYYDGTDKVVLTSYSADGLIAGDEVPVTATFKQKEIGTNLDITWDDLSGNYTIDKTNSTSKGNISKSVLEATLPATASDESAVKNGISYIISNTGTAIGAAEAKVISQGVTVTKVGSGSFLVSGGDTDNYTIVYTSNSIGYKAVPPATGGGDEGDATVTISLDATEKTLPRLEEFVLKATVSPAGQTVTWSSSDPTIASVTADGNKATVKALKVGTATITAKIGSVTATCEVTVDFATGLEEALANTQIYAKQGSIYVNPIQPLQLTIVNMLGKIVYNARISSYAQIPVTNGIYIVKLTNAGNTIVTKVNVY